MDDSPEGPKSLAPRLILLPGMDGQGTLFAPFIDAIRTHRDPKDLSIHALAYGAAESAYDALTQRVLSALPREAPLILLAESFSGPIAIRIGAMPPKNLRGVVPVSTFAQPPGATSLARRLKPRALTQLLRISPPRWAIHTWMAQGATAQDLAKIQMAITQTPPRTLAARLHQIATVNEVNSLADLSVPGLALHPTRDRLVRQRLLVPTHWEQKEVDGPHLLLQVAPVPCAAHIADFCAHVLSKSFR